MFLVAFMVFGDEKLLFLFVSFGGLSIFDTLSLQTDFALITDLSLKYFKTILDSVRIIRNIQCF